MMAKIRQWLEQLSKQLNYFPDATESDKCNAFWRGSEMGNRFRINHRLIVPV